MKSNFDVSRLKKAISDKDTVSFSWIGRDANVDISPNGKFCAFSIEKGNSVDLVIKSTVGSWEYVCGMPRRLRRPFFSIDSKLFSYCGSDTLHFITLGTDRHEIITDISFVGLQQSSKGTGVNWVFWKKKGSDVLYLKNMGKKHLLKIASVVSCNLDPSQRWLVCKIGYGDSLYIYDLRRETGREIESIEEYWWSNSGSILAVQSMSQEGNPILYWIDPLTGYKTEIWRGVSDEKVMDCVFDNNKLAFQVVQTINGVKNMSVWYYERGDHLAKRLIDNLSKDVDQGLELSANSIVISGDNVSFNMIPRNDKIENSSGSIKMDVWSYKDEVIYPGQMSTQPKKNRKAFINIRTAKVVKLGDGESCVTWKGDYGIIVESQVGDRFWEGKEDGYKVWLQSFKDGSRILLPIRLNYRLQGFNDKANFFYIDEESLDVVYFDAARGRHFYQYDIRSGTEIKMTDGVGDNILGIADPSRIGWDTKQELIGHGVFAWMKGGSQVLVYDDYDIWKIDLKEKVKPKNLTGGYGRRNNVMLRLCKELAIDSISYNQTLQLVAFNSSTIENGFYELVVGDEHSIKKLWMGASCIDLYDFPPTVHANLYEIEGGMHPLKASRANAWLVRREDLTTPANYFFTTDFKQFHKMSQAVGDVKKPRPTAELIKFIQEDGKSNQCILYKPNDFDSTKKYPVLFSYYGIQTYLLNQYRREIVTSNGQIEPLYFVNKGYLVCCVDICFDKQLGSGKSALQAVEGAVKALSGLSYVNIGKIGIAGHSFGGGHTNYIITHSTKFTAAIEGAGVSDYVTGSLQLTGIDSDLQQYSRLESTELGRGGSLWENKEEFLASSPILSADKVTTPLLIFHCKKDGSVPFLQGLEMFTALRRLNKKVWLLQYDEGEHGVNFGKDAVDLTTRMTQFFDYFLKDAPPPVWMTKGIPRYLKGAENGLKLDSSGSKP